MDGGLIRAEMQVAVLGFGLSGQAALAFAQAVGARVRISDSGDTAHFAAKHGAMLDSMGIAWEAGQHSRKFLAGIDAAIVSPGVSLHQDVIDWLSATGVPLYGELALAAPLFNAPVIAITGTNGKTTVTTLIGEILKAAGNTVFVGGNIGAPLLRYVLSGEKANALVLEVSSFQLQLAGTFAPRVGVLLNITPDHFDLHADMDEYAAAKMRLFAHQQPNDAAVICLDDDMAAQQSSKVTSRLIAYGHGENCLARIGEHGARLRWRGVWEDYDLTGSPLDFPIGISNATAAICAARAFGVESAKIAATLRAFMPLPHRLQLVREVAGVRYVDDSKGTNTGAVVAALEQTPGHVVLIAGGRHKGEDYRLLTEAVTKHCRHLVLIGEAAPLIAGALVGAVPMATANDMTAAVQMAARLAQPGDTVLLSPACSSFDMFRDYAERGEVFAAAVHTLPEGERP